MRLPVHGWSKLRRSRKAEITMMLAFTIWLLLVLIAPFTLPPNSVGNLSGRVGEIDNEDQLVSMNPLARVVYTLGDINCHQIAERSLYLNDNQMPFCSRDLGIFIGLLVGLAMAIFLDIRISILIVLALLVPMAVDGILQVVADYESTNALRLLTGILGGIAIGLLLSRIAHKVLDTHDVPGMEFAQ